MTRVDDPIDIAIYQQEKQGKSCCGDSYYYHDDGERFICALADGLGSGKYAKESSQTVINVVKANRDVSEDELIHLCREALVGQRGVVLGILVINHVAKCFRFLSIGNVGLRTITSDFKKGRNLPSRGYLGGCQSEFSVMHGNLKPGMTFILFTDGVTDAELSVDYFLYANVHHIVHTYESLIEHPREDDTTLIALHYIGDQ